MKKFKSTFQLLTTILLVSLFFSSCSEGEQTPKPILDEEASYKPFFTVEKGESISKDTYRQKPKFDTDVEVLYSSENDNNNVKSATPYVTDLYILTGNTSSITPPASYTKINVDLNKGSGGKYIYLCYTKDSSKSPLTGILAYAGVRFPNPPIGYPWSVVANSNGYGDPGTDLNEGAGGDWIYLYETRTLSQGSKIKQVAVVATSSSHYNPCCGWKAVNTNGKIDLNKGAGGKYIYVLYKN